MPRMKALCSAYKQKCPLSHGFSRHCVQFFVFKSKASALCVSAILLSVEVVDLPTDNPPVQNYFSFYSAVLRLPVQKHSLQDIRRVINILF